MKSINGVADVNVAYFIGIAGIGMSALARYFNQRGVRVFGYDRDRSALAIELEAEGMIIHYTEDVKQIPDDMDLVVYTPAIPSDSRELMYARSLDIPVMKRSEVLGVISRETQCIAVAGTHGKTTTSALTTHALKNCGVDCTAFLGGIVSNFKGNFVQGNSNWTVVEADEFDRSFLQLTPSIAIVTTLDPDHLDIYGSFEEMQNAYRAFIMQVKDQGVVVIHDQLMEWLQSDAQMIADLDKRSVQIISYGTNDSSAFRLEEYHPEDDFRTRMGYGFKDRKVVADLGMPGRHNAINALAATAVGECVVGSQGFECSAASLSSFGGIKRRFELIYSDDDIVVIDDYAHHPNEVRAAIEGVQMQYAGRKVTGIFQPHLYTRTRDFFKDFASSLSMLDTCILVEIYPARELPIDGVSSEMIFDVVEAKEKFLTTKKKLIDLLRHQSIEVLLLMGAGDLDRMSDEIINAIRNTTP